MGVMSDSAAIASSSQSRPNAWLQLLLPSMWSGFLCLVISLTVLVCTVGQIHYKNGDFYKYFGIQPTQVESPVSVGYDKVVERLDSNPQVGYAPLLIFWAACGVAVYWFAVLVLRSIHTALEVRREVTDYVHIDRRALIMEPLEKTGIRLLVLAVLYGWLKLTFDIVVPYFIALAYTASGPLEWTTNLTYLATAWLVLAFCLHGFVILTRGLLLRPRIFSSS